MLPPRQAKKAKRSSRWRSQAHLTWLRTFQCAVPGCQGMPIDAAHVRLGSGAGMSQKPDDWRAVPLCQFHHRHDQHVKGEPLFWDTYAKAAGQTVDQLIDALCRESPKRREIAEVRNV